MYLQQTIDIFLASHIGLLKPRVLWLYEWSGRLLVNFLGNILIEKITVYNLRLWRGELSEMNSSRGGKISPWTVRGHLKRIKRIFNWLVQEGYLEKSPAARLEIPPKPQILPKDIPAADIRRLLQEAENSSLRDLALVRLLAETGARVGGICKLRISDLDLTLINGRARAQVTEKGDKTRYIFFSEKTVNVLKAYLAVRPADRGEALFWGRHGHLTEEGVYQILKRLAKRANVQRFNPHAFRHATARRLLNNGAGMEDIAALLGHSDTKVTKEFYAIWDTATLAARHLAYGGLDEDESTTQRACTPKG